MELQDELLRLCAELNQASVKYVVIGGCAVVLHGYFRTTHDIDLLVDPRPENIRLLKHALQTLYGGEDILKMREDDVSRYAVVRFAPEAAEAVIDLIARIGEITYEVAAQDLESVSIQGVTVPLCGLKTLIELKRGVRPKDREDLLFLLGKKEYLDRRRQED